MTPDDQLPPDEDAARLFLADCLDINPDRLFKYIQVFAEVFPRLDDHNWWDRIERLGEAGMILACSAGLPCKPEHEQPYDLGRMIHWLAPINSGRFDDNDEQLFFNRTMFPVICKRIEEWFKTLPFHEAMYKVRTFGVRYLEALSPVEDLYEKYSLEGFLEKCDWFDFTYGCFDLKSGNLTPEGKEIAAMREYLYRDGVKK